MLNPKLLLAETAKFFTMNPDRFKTGALVGSGVDPINADLDTDCFCTVGYMAARLAKESPSFRQRLRQTDAYIAVGEFFKGRFGVRAGDLYRTNDSLGRSGMIDRLKEEVRASA